MYSTYNIVYIVALIISWIIAYFIVAKKNKQVKLFEKHLGFCIVTSMFFYLISFWIVISYVYEPDAPAFLKLIIAAPMYVPLLWSLLLIIHSIQLKYRTSLVELLDD